MISVVMCTARTQCGYEYLVDSLVYAIKYLHTKFGAVPVEFLSIDEEMWRQPKERLKELEDAVAGRFDYQIHAPKPTVWRGPHRLTKRDYWAKNSALNTAICYANYNHLVFIDDCVLVPENFLVGHFLIAQQKVAGCGGYFYHFPGIKIINGKLLEGKPHTPGDYRINKYKDGIQPCSAGELFGGNVSYPLEKLLQVDGFDEILDGSKGLDDCLMGLRVGMTTKTMWVPEIEVHYTTETHEIIDRGQKFPVDEIRNEPNIEKTPGLGVKLFPYKDAQGVIHQMTFNHLAIWRLTAHKLGRHEDGVNFKAVYNPKLESCRTDYRPVGNPYSIKVLRNWIQSGKPFPIPTEPSKDWRDRQPLSEM